MKKLCFLLSILLISPIFSGCKSSLEKTSAKLSWYYIDAVYDDASHSLTATQSVDYINSSETELSHIEFNLYASAFREGAKASVVSKLNYENCFPNGASYGGIIIDSVSVSGQTTAYSIGGEDENVLVVPLKKSLGENDRVKITMTYTVTIPNCAHRFGYTENAVNLGNFYPIASVFENGKFVSNMYSSNGDPFYSDSANYNVSIIAPSNLVVAGSGTKSTEALSQNQTKTNFSGKAMRNFAMVLSEKFKTVSDKIDGVNVSYYYYDDASYSQNLKTACYTIRTFNSLFGNYPYTNYSVVQTDFIHGGMEYAGLVYISSDVKNADDLSTVIIHETAHQWWQSVVGNNEFDNAWMDEALAEFSTALFYKNNPEYNQDFNTLMTNVQNQYLFFCEVYTDVLKELDTSISRKLTDFRTEPEYTFMTYVKGNMMFYNLYKNIGEKKFLKALRSYYKSYSFKNASPQNLIDEFSKASHTKLDEYFNSWLSGRVVIEKI